MSIAVSQENRLFDENKTASQKEADRVTHMKSGSVGIIHPLNIIEQFNPTLKSILDKKTDRGTIKGKVPF